MISLSSVTARAPAKVNLGLAVGPPRQDGYHDVATVYHAVSLFDEVTVSVAERDVVEVTGEGAAKVPTGEDNLALRAARALAGVAGPPGGAPGVAIRIHKRIPVAAGLAGGSADAAAALIAVNELWRAGLTPAELAELAASLGSDVAFALVGGTAIGVGRGERVTPALAAGQYHWALAFAAGELSTARVYAVCDRLRASRPDNDDGAGPAKAPGGGAASRRAAAPGHPAVDTRLMAALRSGDAAEMGRCLSNDLQPAALSLCPDLRRTLAVGREFGALGAIVSGSGPSCAFLAADARHAADLAVALAGAGVCRTAVRASGPVPGASLAGPAAG